MNDSCLSILNTDGDPSLPRLPLIRVGRAIAFRLLREAIERAALEAVRISQEAG